MQTLQQKQKNVRLKTKFKIEFNQTVQDRVNVHWRDPKHAQDQSTSIDAVQEFIRSHPKVNNLALIQCTSPFITRKYLRKAMREFLKRHCTFSVFRSFKLRWSHDEENNKVLPINFDYKKRPRRQDWKGEQNILTISNID